MGYQANAEASSVVLGYQASGKGNTVAIGRGSASRAEAAVSLGLNASAIGKNSMSIGANSYAKGNESLATGYHATSLSYRQITLGSYNTEKTDSSLDTWVDTDPIFVIGNGKDSNNRSDAVVVAKNGDTTINGNTTINGEIKADRIVTEPKGGISMGEFGKPQEQ